MKRILSLITVTLLMASAVQAQPAKRRVPHPEKTEQAAKASATDRASLMFPTSDAMPDDVVWKRDIYRQLDLTKDKNAPMYYPVEPMGKQVNLFTYLFRLILTGRVNAYTYKLDGNESFDEKDKLAVKDMLERYGIYYEEDGGKLTVADSDVPSAEATRYYIKESIYMDQRTGTFTTKVTALCPILMRGADEFSSEATPYPLFWVKYDDVAPWLAKLPMMAKQPEQRHQHDGRRLLRHEPLRRQDLQDQQHAGQGAAELLRDRQRHGGRADTHREADQRLREERLGQRLPARHDKEGQP